MTMLLDSCTFYTLILALVGLLTIFFLLLDTIWTLLQGFRALLAPYLLPNEENNLTKKFGSWALVTGCTDGIGKAYCKELAKRGLNIILVSRSEEKLTATAKDLETNYPIKTKIIVADFSTGAAAINNIRKELGKFEIGILVNNVGTQYTYPMYVGEVPDEELWGIINVNIGAITLLTKTFIEDMKQRGKGAIVNVSSGSEMQPLPLMAAYAASKAYVKNFTAALRYEYVKYGVTIQHLTPMFINTKMNAFSNRLQKDSFFVPNAESYARYAASTLGKLDHSTGYWSHGIQYFFISLAPVWLRTHIGGMLNKSFRKEYFQTNNIKISSVK